MVFYLLSNSNLLTLVGSNLNEVRALSFSTASQRNGAERYINNMIQNFFFKSSLSNPAKPVCPRF